MQVSDSSVMSLTCVEEARHVVGHSLGFLGAQDRWHEFFNGRRVLFFIDHVVANDQVWILLLALPDVVQNLSHVRLSDHLVAREDESHLKVRYTGLDLINDSLDHLKFFK